MATIRLNEDVYERAKSFMDGRSWNQFLNDLMDQACKSPGANRTNNNASAKPPIPPSPVPYVEHDRAIILPSGTVLVNQDKEIIDINGNAIIFPDIPSVRKMVKYLREYTSHPFQRTINPWRGNIITIERWYTEQDIQSGIPAAELAESQQFTSQPMRTVQAECV